MTRLLILLCFWLAAAESLLLGAPLLNAAESDGLAALSDTARADELLDRMIGQTIMVGFSGADEHDPGVKAVREELAKGLIGGVVLYPENIRSARQLRLLTAYLSNAKSDLVPYRRGPGGWARAEAHEVDRVQALPVGAEDGA